MKKISLSQVNTSVIDKRLFHEFLFKEMKTNSMQIIPLNSTLFNQQFKFVQYHESTYSVDTLPVLFLFLP